MSGRARLRTGLLLARHGETDDNIPPVHVQGFSDTPLNAVGARQAAELADRLVGEPIVSVWSSDLVRASETARIVGAKIGIAPRLDSRLREGNRGDWEGRLFIDVEREQPEHYAAWRRAGAEFRFPGGESLREHSDRVAAALADIRSWGELPALVVCHQGSIRVTLCHGDPRGLDAFHEYRVRNGEVVRL